MNFTASASFVRIIAMLTVLAIAPTPTAVGAQEDSASESPKRGFVVSVPLPLSSSDAESIEQQLRQIAETAQEVVRADDRPIVILRFDTTNNRTGRGSPLGASLELARLLVSPDLNRIRTIAFVPAPSGKVASIDGDSPELRSQLMGHPILVALAADDLVVAPDAAIGRASIDEPQVTNLIREVYRDVAGQRLTLPIPVTLAMVDPSAGLYRVVTDEGVVYANTDELEKLESDGRAIETTTLCPAGQLCMLTGQDLDRLELTRIVANDLAELARRVGVDPQQLVSSSGEVRKREPVQVRFPETLDAEMATWIFRSVNNHLSRNKSSLLIFRFDTTSGDLAASLKLARRIAELDPERALTVAYLEGPTRGPATAVAMACDHILVRPDATLGGDYEPLPQGGELNDAQAMARTIAEQKRRDGALGEALLNPQLELMRYRNTQTGQLRLMTVDEAASQADAEAWAVLGPVDLMNGISAQELEQWGVARRVVDDFEQVLAFYNLDSSPPALQPTEVEKWLKRVAAMLASPFVAPWLLFAAVFFLSTEMSAPGVGVPGFLGAVCLMLFFWSQFLDGNADWLEILLFAVGVGFILVEIFLLPGFGIFGVGGILMVVASLILASQDFLIPMDSQQFQRMSLSILPVVGAGAGFFTAMYVLRRALPNTPYLNRLMLPPPQRETDPLREERDPEMLVDWSDLVGRKGITTSKLVPAGKARIGDRIYDVISDGRMIERGVTVIVDRVVGNRIEVSELDSSSAQ